MRRILVLVLATMAATIGVTQVAQAAPTGTVLYAFHTPYVYPDGPLAAGVAQGRLSVSATFDGCPPGGAACEWFVQADAVATVCQPSPDGNPYPYGGWSSAPQTANATVTSGERTFAMGTPNELELTTICLYTVQQVGLETFAALVDVKPIDPEPVGAPAPVGAPGQPPAATPTTPAPLAPSATGPPVAASLTLTARLALKTSRARLAKRFASWRRSARRSVTCRRGTAAASASYSCIAKWRYRGKRRRAALTVVVRNDTPVARLR